MNTKAETTQVISVNIADRHYEFKCAPEDVLILQEAAHMLDSEAKALGTSTSFNDREKLMVLSAFKVCYKLLSKENPKEFRAKTEANARVKKLEKRITDFCTHILNE